MILRLDVEWNCERAVIYLVSEGTLFKRGVWTLLWFSSIEWRWNRISSSLKSGRNWSWKRFGKKIWRMEPGSICIDGMAIWVGYRAIESHSLYYYGRNEDNVLLLLCIALFCFIETEAIRTAYRRLIAIGLFGLDLCTNRWCSQRCEKPFPSTGLNGFFPMFLHFSDLLLYWGSSSCVSMFMNCFSTLKRFTRSENGFKSQWQSNSSFLCVGA